LSDPGLSHWTAAKKVLRYLKGTKDFILTYRRSNILDVVRYSNVDFAGCSDDRRSTFGYIFMMARGSISWKSVKQTLTASSTMEAEYIACYQATCQAIWLRNFISRLVFMDTIAKPLMIFCDKSAAISFSRNTGSSSRSKHIVIKYLFVREKVAESYICVVHTPRVFQKHVTHMGLLESSILLS
jgi:hypothetical protein